MSKEIAEEWLKSALADLKNIEHILTDNFLTHIAAFHAQQCVEKCFKAILEFNTENVPKEHSIIKLYGRIKQNLKIEVNTDILTDLDDMYIEARYPGDMGLLPHGKPTLKDAEEFYNFANYIYKNVKEIVED